jgi:hypothetical protein
MTTPPKLYLIPGMGADARLFEGLRREGLEFEVLEFTPPIAGESLRDYALRMGERIDTSQPYVLGGQSLGGTMATEIASVLHPEKLILISSLKNSREFPPYFKLGRYLPLHRLGSGKFWRENGPRAGLKRIPEWQAKILKDMRNEASDDFVEWAVNAVVNWKSDYVHPNCLHIHGTRDFLLPGAFVRGRVAVRGGRHIMVLTHAREVVAEIRKFLELEPTLLASEG